MSPAKAWAAAGHIVASLQRGEAWFIGFLSTGFQGRIAHLLPVKWGGDDRPVYDDHGQPVMQRRKPAVGRALPIEHPQRMRRVRRGRAAPDLAVES